MTTYQATVTREGEWWLASVHGLDGGSATHARGLLALDEAVRDVIVLAEDLPDEAGDGLDVEYLYDVDDEAVRNAAHLAADRARITDEMERVRAATDGMVAELRHHGYSVRDTAVMLGITAGRVAQIEGERVA